MIGRLMKGRDMTDHIELLTVVALVEGLPDHQLQRGQVRTLVEVLADGVYEVEFSDPQGRAYAMLALPAEWLMALHYEPIAT